MRFGVLRGARSKLRQPSGALFTHTVRHIAFPSFVSDLSIFRGRLHQHLLLNFLISNKFLVGLCAVYS